MNNPFQPRIGHSEVNLHVGRSLSNPKFRKDATLYAIRNMPRRTTFDDASIERGMRVVKLVELEESIRLAHIYRTRAALGLPATEKLNQGADADNIVEAALVDFDALVADMQQNIPDKHWSVVGKGISGELGHIEQFGSWDASHPLDDAIRGLPSSSVLQDAGIAFEHVHGTADAEVNYDIRHYDGPELKAIVAIRKRAVANVIGSTGLRYDVIRRSSFDIEEQMLSPELKRLMDTYDATTYMEGDDVHRTAGGKEKRKQAANDIGKLAVEALVKTPSLRSQEPVSVPLTSVYMALLRHEDVPYDTAS